MPRAVEEILEKLIVIEQRLNDIKNHFQPIKPIELMTRKEVALFFKVDISTVHNWTKKGKLQSYGIGARVYYKRKEVENVLIKLF
ncbi:Helix-turn-helix domain-containing protein [Ulvibacter litoralis]|uniref:Helix-turn-helix domain-containing protein n=2 Tax=Ulvibacter litoralis TaxID=227084 RepID=A0A1G7CP74_9FLAO|nr:Helix-turn-helix domain-containing protein [Ulvibacter litoralis]